MRMHPVVASRLTASRSRHRNLNYVFVWRICVTSASCTEAEFLQQLLESRLVMLIVVQVAFANDLTVVLHRAWDGGHRLLLERSGHKHVNATKGVEFHKLSDPD